ncbi:MAG: SDR family oxidoreductase [Bacillaceae bacterium]
MKHALVTAGAKGLGFMVVKILLEQGYNVSASYRTYYDHIEQLQTVYGNRVHFIQCDILKKEEIQYFVEEASRRYGPIDILINNAGPYYFPKKTFIEYSDEEYEELMNGNVKAVFYLMKEVIPMMRKQKFGRIINYGYQGASHGDGWMYRSVFAAAKSALASITKTVAYEEAPYGITVNMVCPGDIIGDLKEKTIEEAKDSKEHLARIGRAGSGEDIGRIIAFLCEEKASFITGSIIDVNGGVDVTHRYLYQNE